VETDNVETGPLDTESVCKYIDISVHHLLRFKERRILVVDVSSFSVY